MPRQAGIKAYFLTDKAIEPTSTRAAPAVADTPTTPPNIPPAPSISQPPSAPTTPSIPRTRSVSGTPATPATPSSSVRTSLKRRGSQALQPDSSQKRVRTEQGTGDSSTCTASADPEDNFPNGPVSVWAMTRGDLCGSQQAFKAYQGGAQSKGNVVVGLYIDKFTEARDFLGRNKIITCR